MDRSLTAGREDGGHRRSCRPARYGLARVQGSTATLPGALAAQRARPYGATICHHGTTAHDLCAGDGGGCIVPMAARHQQAARRFSETSEVHGADRSRRTGLHGISSNDAVIIRLVGALMLEQNDEWAVCRCYMTLERLAAVSHNTPWPSDTFGVVEDRCCYTTPRGRALGVLLQFLIMP